MIIDVCTFNGEYDLWDIHYNVLKDHVDQFIVVEFDKTFSGKDKPIYGQALDVYYDPICTWPKVKHVVFTEEHYEKYRELAESSPNTQGADHWKREFMQKESIKDALAFSQTSRHTAKLSFGEMPWSMEGPPKDDDIVFIGDVDEVWNPREMLREPEEIDLPRKLRLQVYTYYLNNCSSEDFWGTLVSRYKYMKNECLNHLRSNSGKTGGKYGWHFTSMGGPDSVKQKLTDSYTQEDYASSEILQALEYNIAENKDFLGRDFRYWLDESDWPEFLRGNREKYLHLIK